MLKFVAKRLTYGFMVMAGVVCVIFFLFHALPGDPVAMMSGQRSDVSTQDAIRKDLGLDNSLPMQFYFYVRDLSPIAVCQDNVENQQKYEYSRIAEVGNNNVLIIKKPYLRRSFQSNKRVDEIIIDNLWPTFWLAFAAMIFATFWGVILGVIAALKQQSRWDHLLTTASVLGISVPSFVSAILMAIVFGYYLSDYTGLNLTGQLWQEHPIYGRELQLRNLILPAITLGLRPLSIIVQLTRSSMLDVLDQDYIRTAQAKGLRFPVIVVKHALKNALNPVITAVSGWLASLMAGAFFIELVFDWKGLGFVTIKAVQNLDFPVVMGATLFISFVFVLVNILVDVLYAILDPRVRLNA